MTKWKSLILLWFGCLSLGLSAQKPYRITRNGIIIYNNNGQVWTFSPFSAPATGGIWYSDVINDYHRILGDSVHVYSMIIPLSIAFNGPDGLPPHVNRPQRPVIDNIYNHLDESITPVDVYTTLEKHASEPIYSRTDHHWQPLGAYYAAREFARVAKVPFDSLAAYTPKIIHRFVGSMYTFSKDIAVKQSPEDFVYYVPKDDSYKVTYIGHRLGKGNKVLGVTEPYEGRFFFPYKDGSSSAYCTFMGGDSRTAHISTGVRNGRRLLVIKDSFGNALICFLFHSFEDIYVVDFRYFTRNIVDYVRENKITDFLFANNLQHAYSRTTASKMENLLHLGHQVSYQ